MTFGQQLRDLRQKAGLTQIGLAGASGVPLGSIRNYEQDAREPYWTVLFRLADALKVPVEVFRASASHAMRSTRKRTQE